MLTATIAEVKAFNAALKNVRVKRSEAWEEYRVNFIGGKEDTAYYTSDWSDAADTAKVMDEIGR
jgi:hypothetical protein